jgi:hypothetical protein
MRLSIFILGLFAFSICSAQVNFSSISFNDALQRAQSEGKLIFLQFEAAACNQCNDVANKGLQDKDVADKINQTFFCLKISPQHPDRFKIASTYSMDADKGFGTLFLDNNGTAVHKFLKTTSFSREYLNQVDIALSKAGENLAINELEKEYKKGNRSFGFLEVLLQKRKALNMPTDSLLDEYVEALPGDSLKSTNTLVFIAQMSPLIGSKADEAIRRNLVLFNKSWYAMPSQTRSNINNVMIHKSMLKAIKEKDEKYAIRTASFAQSTNGSNYAAGAKAYDLNMLRFYDETGDTTAYFRKAIAYFERYFLTVSPDSIKRIDSVNLQQRLALVKKDTIRDENNNFIKTSAQVVYAPVVQSFSRELNNGAYEFYKKTNNPYLLSIATEWVEKALQFYQSPEVLDTYAKLLYKQNKNAKAIEMMSEAVTLQQKRGFPTKEYETSLEKMRSGKSL